MAISANPRKRDFYVYQFKVDGYPFYVGIGRSKRGSDRERFVRSLLRPHNKARLERSSLCVRVIAKLIRKIKDRPRVRYYRTRKPMTRLQALALEKKRIERLVKGGYLLTNWQHNPYRHRDANRAVRAIMTGLRISN